MNLRSMFSNSLFVHSLHSFLNGFQQNLYQHFSNVCSTCHTIFSLLKALECIYERLLHCRLIVAITWTPLHKLLDAILMYHYVL